MPEIPKVCATCGQVVTPQICPPPPPAIDIIQVFAAGSWDWHFLNDERVQECEEHGVYYRVCHIPAGESHE